MRRDAFAGFHPAVNLCFFAVAIGLSMFLMHPVFLTISLLCSGAYLWYLQGAVGFRRQLGFLLPVLVFTAALNPLFNHEGVTVLFYLQNGNPVTFEALCFGLASAVLMAASILWFSCCNAVFTTDKIIFLFGRIIPSLSLLISMTLRFVPRFRSYLQRTMQVQRAMQAPGGKLGELRQALTAFSATVSWAMEQSIVTADSMKSRGYGLPGRTAFSIFRFDKRDRKALLAIALTGGLTYGGAFAGTMYWRYFPSMKGVDIGFISILTFLAYGALCMVPVAIQLWEERTWKRLQSNI